MSDNLKRIKSFVLLCIKNSDPDKETKTGNVEWDNFMYHAHKAEESAYFNVLRRINELAGGK